MDRYEVGIILSNAGAPAADRVRYINYHFLCKDELPFKNDQEVRNDFLSFVNFKP